jgi:transcriptional regulator with XRE-family HTH domain/anti-sigma regulatory factor (Ser/Thr protein kinase)
MARRASTSATSTNLVNAEIIPLASRLRQRREELGLTQAQAARQLDVARTAYRLWEMEAAKPAPDRWRTIAQWLGISMTVMLLAEELIDEREAMEASRVAAGGGMTERQWDAASNDSVGDYFSQERALIADQARLGNISAAEAASLSRVLSRIQRASSSNAMSAWHPGQFRKRFANDTLAPALARGALATTAIGIPVDVFDAASILTSELVTNSVSHSHSDWIDVAITLTTNVLRVEVSDQDRHTIRPRTPDLDGGWGLALVGELATRWGVERHAIGKTVWIEIDLERPAEPNAPN